MTQRGRYGLTQLLLVGLCFVSLLFSLFREQLLVRDVVQRYELPYLGSMLLRILDTESTDTFSYTVRAFEDSNSVRAFILDGGGRFLYPENVPDKDSEMLEQAHARMLNLGYGSLYEAVGKDGAVLWGTTDSKTGRVIFIMFSQRRMLEIYRQESHKLTTIFLTVFLLLVSGSVLIVRRVFRSTARDMQRGREQLVLLQAVIEAQASLVRKAQSLMKRCCSGLRDRDPLDPVAEDLCGCSTYLENSLSILQRTLVSDETIKKQETIHLHTLCTRSQGLVADEYEQAGVVLTLRERDTGLYVHGQETLLLLALEDLLHRVLPMVSHGSRIGMTIASLEGRAVLDITVPAKERLFHPSVFFLSGFIFELLGINLSYLSDENMELVLHVDFSGSGV